MRKNPLIIIGLCLIIVKFVAYYFNSNGALQEANARMHKKQYDEKTLDLLDQAMMSNPQDARVYGNLAEFYIATNKLDTALGEINQGLALISARGDIRLALLGLRSITYTEKSNYDLALKDANEIIAMKPDEGGTYLTRAAVYEKLQQYDQAMSDLDKAVQLNPKKADFITARGALESEQGFTEKSLADFNQALVLAPNNVMTFISRGEVYFGMNDYAHAIQDFDRAEQLASQKPNLFYTRGLAKLYSGSTTAAIDDLKKAVSLDPPNGSLADYHVLWLHIANLHVGQDDHVEFDNNTAKFTDGKWPVPVMTFYQGKFSVEELYQKALTGDAKAQHDQTCEANFYAGEFYLSKNMKPEAIKSFQTANSTCPVAFTEHAAARAELKNLGL